MSRLVAAVAAGALAAGLTVATGGPAHAGLKVCNDYIATKNYSCDKASSVAEQGLAMLLDSNKKTVKFDGWTCKRKTVANERFTCRKNKQVVKYLD